MIKNILFILCSFLFFSFGKAQIRQKASLDIGAMIRLDKSTIKSCPDKKEGIRLTLTSRHSKTQNVLVAVERKSTDSWHMYYIDLEYDEPNSEIWVCDYNGNIKIFKRDKGSNNAFPTLTELQKNYSR